MFLEFLIAFLGVLYTLRCLIDEQGEINEQGGNYLEN